jgi:DNA invertase Pin-like site-specific DNA recombinase
MTEDVRPARAYSYIRMSTKRQAKGLSRERQRKRSKEWDDKNGLYLIDDFYLEDIGVSGYTGENVTIGELGKFLKLV